MSIDIEKQKFVEIRLKSWSAEVSIDKNLLMMNAQIPAPIIHCLVLETVKRESSEYLEGTRPWKSFKATERIPLLETSTSRWCLNAIGREKEIVQITVLIECWCVPIYNSAREWKYVCTKANMVVEYSWNVFRLVWKLLIRRCQLSILSLIPPVSTMGDPKDWVWSSR